MKLFYLLALGGGFWFLGNHAFFGREYFGARKRAEMPPNVRQTPGAWRTFLHNNGFRGGK